MCLNLWGDPAASSGERQATDLCRTLAERFDAITWRPLPRRINYAYYPVIGVMAGTPEEQTDLGVRLIGLPAGYQMTSLIAAIQTVSFQGQSLEPVTRVQLRKMEQAQPEARVAIELLTSAEDEAGALVAKVAFGMAVASDAVRTFLVMTDAFPEAAAMYSATYLPHTVINKRVHYEGVPDEAEMLRQIAKAVARPG